LKKSFPVIRLKETQLSLEGAIFYSDRYYSDYSDFSHASIKAELSKKINNNFQIYVSGIAQKKLNSFGGKVNDDLMCAIGLRYNFR